MDATAAAEAWILEAAFAVEQIQDQMPDSEGIPPRLAELAVEGTPWEKCAHAALACSVRQKMVSK